MKRKEGAFVVAQAAIFVGVIALVALPVQSANQMQVSTSSSAGEGPLAFTSGVSPQGLQLEVTLNSSSIQSHGAIIAQVELVNKLTRNVSTTLPPWSPAETTYVWSGYDQICNGNPSDYIADFAVFQGRFSAGNVSSAGTPLRLVPPIYPPCPGSSSPSAVTLLPNGDLTNYTDINYTQPPPRPSYTVKAEVNATTYYCTGSGLGGGGGEIDCGNTTGLVGYWNSSTASPGGDFSYTSHAFTYFPPGAYTIAATDPWGQYVYATFVVQAPASSTISTTTVDPSDGFPRNAAGGWDMHYVGSDPNPIGCNYSLGSTFGDGYSLSVYSEYDAVKEGGLVCISVVLVNVSGAIVTWGNSSEVETGFNVTDSSRNLVFQDSCVPSDEPTIYPGASNARTIFECGGVWDTSVPSAAGAAPTPGTYIITAFASYPGTTNQPPVLAVTRESVNFTVLSIPSG